MLLLFNRTIYRHLDNLSSSTKASILGTLHNHKPSSPNPYLQKRNYVNVYMKWKKDSYYDSIDAIHKSIDLQPLIALKNCIAQAPNSCIPISLVSKRGPKLGVSCKVARFLRLYPSIFEEFTGPEYNLPWFRLTPEAVVLDREEREISEIRGPEIRARLKKLILMSKEKRLPLKIIHGVKWYLGLPDNFITNLDSDFWLVNLEDGMAGLAVNQPREKVLSTLQRNATKEGEVEFPLFPSPGLRLRTKVERWMNRFRRIPYVSPYEDFSTLDPSTDESEKRIVGVTHELLSLFVEHSAERKRILCLRPYLGLPQKFHKVFERHPHMFYLSLRNKTCTAILKEAYNTGSRMEDHPLSEVRRKYIKLMKESESILRKRRMKKSNRPVGVGNVEQELGSESGNEGRREVTELA